MMIRNIVYFFLFILLGCSEKTQIHSIQNKNDVSCEKNSVLTYGIAKKNIIVGETNQEDIVKLFGSPDNMILKKESELWIYDRFRIESSSKSSSEYGTLLLMGGSNRSSLSSSYTKTITLIVSSDKNGVVKDFNMRSGGY